MELLHCKAAHLGSLEQLRKLVRRSDAEFGICADVSLMTPDEMELSLQDAKTRSDRLAVAPEAT